MAKCGPMEKKKKERENKKWQNENLHGNSFLACSYLMDFTFLWLEIGKVPFFFFFLPCFIVVIIIIQV